MRGPKSKEELAARLTSYLKDRIAESELGYKGLAELLTEQGFDESENSIKQKLKRGVFSAVFFLAAADVLGLKAIVIRDVHRS